MKVLFIGDICTDSYSIDDIDKFKKTKLYFFLKNYDGYIVANLEAPLLNNKIFDNKNKFSLVNLKELSSLYDFCDFFNLANNHILDQGEQGLKESIEEIDRLSSNFFGAGNNINEARKPAILDLGGKKVGLLSYCCYSSNSESYANINTSGPSPLIFENIKEDVINLKKHVDYIYILPHWGVENEFFPTYDQASLARKIIDLGVNGIIGGHTHTIQCFERYSNQSIYYSLGNFLFNDFIISDVDKYYQGAFNKEGLLVEIDFSDISPKYNEYYVSLSKKMIPEFKSVDNLITPVGLNNLKLADSLKGFSHKPLLDNLNLLLKYNGKSMQVINDSPFVGSSFKPRLESYKSKIKRVTMFTLKRLFLK
ncbi:CapA family protein [Photobacterium profundum]|uniref:Capsule biosynthesis protein, putative n=1 Tax=Photobacterium profundum 3TCK TaxID=314280 RepID=Q1Z868_9GAMM|nr:CapA family protein [Photobacterium profundum]EAS44645.1 capsule biosynthesis protein, putative [Photobacterium profundum 3TCK]PSV60637.1 CapA family protein [Photobacterium profundum]